MTVVDTAAQPATVVARPSRAARARRSVRRYLPVAGVYLLVVVAWELVVRNRIVQPYILAAPTAIVGELVDRFPLYLQHSGVTVNETILGFLLGSGIGFLVGLAIAYSKAAERVIYPAVIFTQTVPKLALAPLFTVWFGVGILPKVLITALICLFPVLVNTVTGVKGVDPRLSQLMSSLSASRWQKFRMIELPGALPSIFAGLQVGATLAVVGALVGEWVGADKGLGYLILYDNSQLRTVGVFASLVMVTALGIVFFALVRWLERLALPHRPPVELDASAAAGM